MIPQHSDCSDVNDFRARTFATLVDRPTSALDFDDICAAAQAAFWKIKHPVQTTWGEHIPFLFSLIFLLKPRRFVELGVHNGGSFFAACQAVKHFKLETTCVAVDNWQGDAHAGRGDAAVFQKFSKRLNKEYSGFAGYLATDFDQAVQQFAAGSIDILHIDGLHVTDVVKHDFETWLEKLSSQGVVLIHDTNEFRPDFGVWRFWHRIRDRYPHLEFGHGHGLGVLAVGEQSRLRRDVDGWSTSLVAPEPSELIQILYGGIGQLTWARTLASEAGLKTELSKSLPQKTIQSVGVRALRALSAALKKLR